MVRNRIETIQIDVDGSFGRFQPLIYSDGANYFSFHGGSDTTVVLAILNHRYGIDSLIYYVLF